MFHRSCIPLLFNIVQSLAIAILLFSMPGCLKKNSGNADAINPAGVEINMVSNFKFTAYIEFGEKKIAVINNDEYAQGDFIKGTNYLIVEITRYRILVYDRSTSSSGIILYVDQGV